MPSPSTFAPRADGQSDAISIPLSSGAWWMIGAVLISLALYYFLGVDEGALSMFGKSMFIHEFVHDSRHFLGFPCH